MKPVDSKLVESTMKLQRELSSGLLYTHSRITHITKKTLEASAFLYALIELLSENGLISIEDLNDRKRQVAERLVRKFEENRIGLLFQEPEEDKYAFSQNGRVDCASRLPACKAICCKIPFALSRQDVEEGIVRWEFGRPYLIAHNEDSYCVHFNQEALMCRIYDNRPVPCRGFDCRDNAKWPVWQDFKNLRLNEEFDRKVDDTNTKIYACPK